MHVSNVFLVQRQSQQHTYIWLGFKQTTLVSRHTCVMKTLSSLLSSVAGDLDLVFVRACEVGGGDW